MMPLEVVMLPLAVVKECWKAHFAVLAQRQLPLIVAQAEDSACLLQGKIGVISKTSATCLADLSIADQLK